MSSKRSNKSALQDKNQWQLQAEGGRRFGPLTTADMLERIQKGVFVGDEKIRKLPDGPWIDISKEPVFYDQLLEMLDKSIGQTSRNNSKEMTDDDETKIFQPPQTPLDDDDATQIRKPQQQEFVHEQEIKAEIDNLESPLADIDFSPVVISEEKTSFENLPVVPTDQNDKKNLPALSVQKTISNLELKKPSEVEKPTRSGFRLLLGLFGGLFVFVLMVFLFEPKLLLVLGSKLGFKSSLSSKKEGLTLLAPKIKNRSTLGTADVTKFKQEVYAELNTDTVESYFKAQENLLQLIEGKPDDSEAKGLLCYVHLQLWPFVKQSSEDLEAALSVKRMANNYEDLNKIHCEVTYLMMTGRYNEAFGVIQEVGNRNDLPQSAILNSLRAEILASKQNYKEAIPWARSASEDWKFWLRPKFQMAYYLKESAEYDQAAAIFNEILGRNASHKLTLIEFGTLLYERKINLPFAEKYLTSAEQNKARVFRDQESKLYFSLSRLYLDQQKKEKALSFAQKAFQLNPGDLKARELVVQLGGSPSALMKGAKNYELIFLGDQFFRAGDYLAAQAEYKTAFEIDSTSALAAEKAAKSLWLLYQKQDAIKWLGNAISADPKMGSSYYLMVDYYSQLFNFQGAAEALSKGARALPNGVEIEKAFGLVEYRRRNFKGAVAHLEPLRKKYDSDVDILILLAKAYLALGSEKDLELAKSAITKALILDDFSVEAQVLYGKILARSSLDGAVDYFITKIKKYSETPEFRIGFAETLMEAERIKDAQNQYESTLLLYEKNKQALMGLADCYNAQEMWLPALKKYIAAAIIDPLDPEPVFKSGLVYLQAKRFQEAKTQFQRGLNVLKVYPKGYYYLGRAAQALKDYPLALQAVAEERKNNPELADSYILAGEIYSEMRDFNKCATEFQSAIRLRPKGAEIYVKLAQCLAWSGNLESAEAMLNIATAQDSGYAEIYKVQGFVFEKQGQVQEAAQSYEKYIILAPNAADKKEVESRIKQLDGRN